MKRLPAEWEKQDCILMSFPHDKTDWADDMQSAISVFVRIASSICFSQKLILVCDDVEATKELFCYHDKISFVKLPTNDTWIRDYGFISIKENDKIKLLDFRFDGWGNKFESSLDNKINSKLYKSGFFADCKYESIDFTLEGGSIESDGNGTILTTSKCLCNVNRNGGLSKDEVEKVLAKYLGAIRVLWLDYGYLSGDDTDSHIDTLARFVNHMTIAYVKCDDKSDEHYDELKKMEQQLKSFTTVEGKPYNLIPLPMPEAKFDKKGNRLPATYANFLITNDALLYPTYDDKNDKLVGNIFKELFPNKEIIPINCLKLIEQGGSLHCSTMQVAL
jgi:agmatine deiminase